MCSPAGLQALVKAAMLIRILIDEISSEEPPHCAPRRSASSWRLRRTLHSMVDVVVHRRAHWHPLNVRAVETQRAEEGRL